MSSSDHINKGRRSVLLGAGVALGAAAGYGLASQKEDIASIVWNGETDVICVGSGAAAGTAAITARLAGAEVMVIEKMPILGGTTRKSSGVAWVPNHRFLRARGVRDAKDDCLRFLARFAYPNKYYADSPELGLSKSEYELLEAFYDNGAAAIDMLEDNGIVKFQEFKMWYVGMLSPDYADHLPENKVPRGRAIEPATGASADRTGGGSMVDQMAAWLEAQNVPLLTDHQVTEIIMQDGRAIGVACDFDGNRVTYKARKGVIFGTGGFSHNLDLVDAHQPGIYGTCSLPGSTGDFIGLAGQIGARMGGLHTAWRTQVVLEDALENRAIGRGAFVLPGDSMIVVNKYGKRLTNEKRNYNDRTKSHFSYDPTTEEFPNHLQYMIFDHRSLDAFGGAFPLPADPRGARYLIAGDTWAELIKNLDARLVSLATRTGNERLDASFKTNLAATVAAFNGYAEAGLDPEFGRGQQDYDKDWHLLFSKRRDGTAYPENPYPNRVMHPLAEQGPYFAIILGPGSLDTNGGPVINAQAQVLGQDNRPIAGLYGAGNCIASPTREAYAGAGGTIGPAIAFGYIAGKSVLQS